LLPITHWATHNQTQFDNSVLYLLDVLNNFMKNLFTVKSIDCSILFITNIGFVWRCTSFLKKILNDTAKSVKIGQEMS